MRLIHGALCLSCYNREREVVVGRNAKGVPPKKAAAILRPWEALITDVAGNVRVVGFALCAGVDEIRERIRREFPGASVHDLGTAQSSFDTSANGGSGASVHDLGVAQSARG